MYIATYSIYFFINWWLGMRIANNKYCRNFRINVIITVLFITQVVRKQCDSKQGKSRSPFYPMFEFSSKESLVIPTDFSTINGWYIRKNSTVKVHYIFIGCCIFE